MNKLLTLTFILISMTCLGQSTVAMAKAIEKNPPKEGNSVTLTGTTEQVKALQSYDSTLILSPWHIQQIAAYDAEIKRLGGTTIEAEQRRLANEKQVLINSFMTAKIPDPSRIENFIPGEDKIIVRLKPKNK